jgi:predicted membrane channel-forming protein YqfA (hemolysin III family)
MHPRTGGEAFWPVRLVLFVLLGNSAFVPILYAASLTPHAALLEGAGLLYYYLEGVWFIVGTVFLAVCQSQTCLNPGGEVQLSMPCPIS